MKSLQNLLLAVEPIKESADDMPFSLTDVVTKVTSIGHVPHRVVITFVVSIIVVVAFSLVKYFFGNASSKKEWSELFLDFPIDFCAVITTLLITMRAYLSGEVFGGLLVMSIIIVFFNSLIRKEAIKQYDRFSYWKFSLLGIVSLVLVLIWSICLTFIIF